MKKTIIKYGFISGAMAAVGISLMSLVLKFYGVDAGGFDKTLYVGFPPSFYPIQKNPFFLIPSLI